METPEIPVVEPAEAATPPVEQTPPVVPEKPQVARAAVNERFEALIRKEKEFVRRQQETKSKEQELLDKEAKIREFEAMKEKARLNPMAVLKSLGLTYEQLTDFVLNDQKPTPADEVSVLKEEMSAWRRQMEEEKEQQLKARELEQQKNYEKAIEDFKASVNDFCSQNSDEYELINLHGGQELVYATIEEHFTKTQKILSTKEAADLVEKYLEDQVAKTLETKKFKSRLTPPAAVAETTDQKSPETPKTLTNHMNSIATPSMLPAKTESDRMARALAALT